MLAKRNTLNHFVDLNSENQLQALSCAVEKTELTQLRAV